METVTEAEHIFCMYKLGMEGSGMTALINAIFALDTDNRAKVALGYPELVKVINRFNFEDGYWRDLVERWNQDSHIKLVA